MFEPTTWIVLVDSKTARFIENKGEGTGLHQLPDSVLSSENREPYSDDEGRMRGPGRDDPVRPEKHVEYEPEVERFARSLVEFLTQELNNNRFDRLVLCASPSILGLLRTHMTTSLRKNVKAEYNKNLINVPTNSLYSHFTEIISL